MRLVRAILLAATVPLALAGCKKSGEKAGENAGEFGGGGGEAEYKHPRPKFQITYPTALTVGKHRVDGTTMNLSIANHDLSRELFFVWAPTGSDGDPVGVYPRYGKEADSTKVVEEGTLPGGGTFIINERGPRTFMHAVITTDGEGVLCMTSVATATPDPELLNACKTLAPY